MFLQSAGTHLSGCLPGARLACGSLHAHARFLRLTRIHTCNVVFAVGGVPGIVTPLIQRGPTLLPVAPLTCGMPRSLRTPPRHLPGTGIAGGEGGLQAQSSCFKLLPPTRSPSQTTSLYIYSIKIRGVSLRRGRCFGTIVPGLLSQESARPLSNMLKPK